MNDPLTLAAELLLRRIGGEPPAIGLVLGSGLGGLIDELTGAVSVAFGELPGWPMPGVLGHHGAFVAGRLSSRLILIQSGRYHLYEGFSPAAVVRPVRLMARLGIKTMIFTNAAGGIRRGLEPGDLLLLADHINLTWRNGLIGPSELGELRFPDMSEPYDRGLRSQALEVARTRGVPLVEGVYAGLAGPSYESAAEIRMLERMGADAVGMSTVLEVIAARALGVRCLAISTITNAAAGLGATPLSHQEVLAVGARTRGKLLQILGELIAAL
jgi:purine-nucleoside phosphorylase